MELEKENECGLCISIQENGYTFDWGCYHVIFSKDSEVLRTDFVIYQSKKTLSVYKDLLMSTIDKISQIDLYYEKNIKIIRDYLESIGIRIVGRFSEWEYHNMDACRSSMNFVSRWKNGDYIK